jgi:hypothetical protein
VLVKTRKCFQAPSEGRHPILIAERSGKHKMLIKSFTPEIEMSEFFCNIDFTIPIEYNVSKSNHFTDYKEDCFLPVHLTRLVVASCFGACGYKGFACALGIYIYSYIYDI